MIYLDNAATSFPKPSCVKEAVCDFIDNIGANANRGAYKSAITSSRISYETKHALGEFIHCAPHRIFWTYNATYAINIALRGILKHGDKILITQCEHNALTRPLQHLARTRNLHVVEIPTNRFCELDLRAAKELCRGAKLIIATAANNVTGTLTPLDSLKQIARDSHTLLFVDAAQILGTYPFSMEGVDVVCGSAHKGLMSIMELGFCAFSDNVECDGLIFGGTGSNSESLEQPQHMPDKFESGTQNMHAIAGLNASLKWIKNKSVESIHKIESEYVDMLEKALRKIKGVRICATKGKRIGILSFRCENMAKMTHLLDSEFDICVRAGLHCAISTHKTIGTFTKNNSGTIRISPSVWNTRDDIEATIHAISHIAKSLNLQDSNGIQNN